MRELEDRGKRVILIDMKELGKVREEMIDGNKKEGIKEMIEGKRSLKEVIKWDRF